MDPVHRAGQRKAKGPRRHRRYGTCLSGAVPQLRAPYLRQPRYLTWSGRPPPCPSSLLNIPAFRQAARTRVQPAARVSLLVPCPALPALPALLSGLPRQTRAGPDLWPPPPRHHLPASHPPPIQPASPPARQPSTTPPPLYCPSGGRLPLASQYRATSTPLWLPPPCLRLHCPLSHRQHFDLELSTRRVHRSPTVRREVFLYPATKTTTTTSATTTTTIAASSPAHRCRRRRQPRSSPHNHTRWLPGAANSRLSPRALPV